MPRETYLAGFEVRVNREKRTVVLVFGPKTRTDQLLDEHYKCFLLPEAAQKLSQQLSSAALEIQALQSDRDQ